MTCTTGDVTIRLAGTDVGRLGLASSTLRIAENSNISMVFCANRQERASCGNKNVSDRSSITGEFCGCEIDDPSILCTLKNVTITVTEQSGRVTTFRDAYAVGDFGYGTAEGLMSFTFESRFDAIVGRPLVAA